MQNENMATLTKTQVLELLHASEFWTYLYLSRMFGRTELQDVQ